jgi:hypothetical protein
MALDAERELMQWTAGIDVKQSSRIVTQISKSDDDPEKLGA